MIWSAALRRRGTGDGGQSWRSALLRAGLRDRARHLGGAAPSAAPPRSRAAEHAVPAPGRPA
ncbi:hypothetical protein [Actinomadura alba]|uniref:Uncharacterized protein n=1 Tax=Actinomadura alba TaxID=406431 RepID=A0ABR7M3Y2_9ACTN|nr:hypothetical protein [Actinomadura alba]MBC6471298.1 hypothetical protein [Actinomadura alba]